MIVWNLITNQMKVKMNSFLFKNETEFAKALATAYHTTMVSSATSSFGDKFLLGNYAGLEHKWVLAFSTKTGKNNVEIKRNMEKIFNDGLYLYWDGATFTPSIVIPTNIVVDAGIPEVIFPANSNNPDAFMNSIIKGLKKYHLTIKGPSWMGVI